MPHLVLIITLRFTIKVVLTSIKLVTASLELQGRLIKAFGIKLAMKLRAKTMIETGTLLQGRFLIEDRIGEGGMGAVYLAVDQKFGSRVAVKETFFADAALGDAFEREARLLNGLHHPVFPHVSDHFTENGGSFLVMEYIEGEDLSAILKRGEIFAVPDIMRWTLDLLDGLDYLHSQESPIIHRDIKPNNLKLTSRGNVILLDFGMAKETVGSTQGMKSVFGYSRRYSPLEQIEGTGTDVRSDIFSLGATVFHLLTGKPPVDVLARVSAIVAEQPDPLQLTEIAGRVTPGVAAIIHSALALNADHRFESANAMRNALEHSIRSEPVSSEVPFVTDVLSEKAARSVVPVVRSMPDIPLPQTRASVADVLDFKPAPTVSETQKTFAPIRIRKPLGSRAALWVMVFLGCLAVAGFGVYRAGSADEKIAESPQETATLDLILPENDVAEPITEQTSQERDQKEPPTILKPVDAVEKITTPKKAEAPKVAIQQSRDAATENPDPLVRVKPLERRPKDAPVRRSTRAAERQSSVSDIESILTGVPNEDDLRWEAEQRQRRRMRRTQRENRRYPPPF